MSSMERRAFTRRAFHQEMELRLSGTESSVKALDISREGIGFVWQSPLEVGTEIEVVLYFSESIHVPLLLTVVSCFQGENDITNGVYRVGSIMQSEDAELLEMLIDMESEES